MATTTKFLTGFEHGFIGTAASAGAGLFDAVGTGWSASTSSPRNGAYCAHLVAPANTATSLRTNFVGDTGFTERFAVKVTARPSTGTAVIAWAADTALVAGPVLRISSTGQLSMVSANSTPVTGSTIDTTSWHLIEIFYAASSDTTYWKVDGVDQSTVATGGVAVGFIANAYLGTNATTQPTFTADYDDWIVGAVNGSSPEWYGDGKVIAQFPGSDGTHATITSLSPGDAGTAYSGTPTTVYTMVDDPPATGGWTATRSTTDNIALRTATVGAYAEIKPAVTAETATANAVRAILSYSSVTATANLAACDVRNSAGTVTSIWGTTGGTGADFSELTNFFKGAIVTRPAAGWTAAEVNLIRMRFGGCTSVDVSPVPTVQALMLEVDWQPPPPPTATSVARVSLESQPTPLTRTLHTIKVRARKASGTGTVLLSAALYEGATNRSGDLTTGALTTSLADYTLAIPDASAANITDYSNLELRFWADAATGDTVAVEVARIALSAPASSGPGSNPLAGAVNVAVAVTGSLTVEKPLAGAVNVAVAVTGTLTNTPPALPLAGAVNVAVSDTGTLTSRAVLAGAAINVAVTDTGTLTSRAGLVSAGPNVATVTSSPAITVASPLVGANVTVAVSDTGSLTGRATLAGAVTGAVSVTGTLTNTPASLPLAGAVNVVTVAGSPTITVAAPLAAAVNVATSVTGTAVKHNPLTGAIDVAVSTTGTLTNTPPGGVAIAGNVAVTTQVTGSLSSTVSLVGAGVTVAVSDTGTLTGRAALITAVNVAVSDTGTLTSRAVLAGAVNVPVTVTGSLTNTPPGGNALAGFVNVAVSVTSTAVTQNPLAGAVTVDTEVTGTPTVLRSLTAASSVAVSVTGTLTNLPPGGNPLTGAVNVDTSVTGSLLVTKPLAGAVTVAVTLTGAGGSLRALAGQVLVGTLVTGSVSARAVLASAVDVTVTTAGQVLVIKPLSGAVLTAVTAGTATLTNTGPIVSVSILESSSYGLVGEDAGAGSVLTAGNTTAVLERAMGASVPSSGGSVALIE